ncbi:hypothetical protein KIW84_043078 [Lathyrus oleraceus]|uniref:Magnesium chelatase subunit H N-terminal domain-containing protein n=1 Tax=Pisum sativum TaxID=3888 RepID=A0A9D4XHB1_PEA|nr:hypothetical protein KIW84_043078 [Pisum sativum]
MDSNNNHKEPWDWHGEDYCLQNTIPNFDISEELWNDVPQNGEDLSYMFDAETTPIKACGDLAYSVNNADSNSRYIQKEQLEDGRETSQVKRRRMLQFDSQENASFEVVGYLVEELRDVSTYNCFCKDVKIAIGSLIFVEKLTLKVKTAVKKERDKLDAVLVFPSIPEVMRMNKLRSSSLLQLGQSKSHFFHIFKKKNASSAGFADSIMKLNFFKMISDSFVPALKSTKMEWSKPICQQNLASFSTSQGLNNLQATVDSSLVTKQRFVTRRNEDTEVPPCRVDDIAHVPTLGKVNRVM